MKHWAALIGALLAMAPPAPAAVARKPALLILGMPHFGNPGHDTVNVHVPDVLTPDRQREIEAIVARLAAFRPTRVAVEWPADEQARLDQRYADYRAGRRPLTSNERDQIGLRLAARLGLARVDAVDWDGDPPGQPADYDYPAFAEAHGRGGEWRAWVSRFQTEADAEARLMACTPISAWVRRVNTAQSRLANHQTYFYVARIGDRVGANPGAAWVGTWYTRNLRILDNLRALAADPQARIVAIYGAGHGYLLDRLARESTAFEVADVMALAEIAARRLDALPGPGSA
jgi:hypothetical protein